MADYPNEQQQYHNDPIDTGALDREERTWAMMCHLAAFAGYVVPLFGHIIGPLIVWLIKREDSPFVDDQGKESLNFQITIAIAYLVSLCLIVVIIGFFLFGAVALFNLIAVIVAAIRANEGKYYRYPFCIRFIK